MTVHSLCDHVVHVELLSPDDEISVAAVDLLARTFRSRDADVAGSAGRLEIRSELARPVLAGEVAAVLLVTGVRTQTIFERVEWSIVDIAEVAAEPTRGAAPRSAR